MCMCIPHSLLRFGTTEPIDMGHCVNMWGTLFFFLETGRKRQERRTLNKTGLPSTQEVPLGGRTLNL